LSGAAAAWAQAPAVAPPAAPEQHHGTTMSEQHPAPESHDGPHEGPIRTPKQLIATVIASFAVPVVIIILLANYVDFGAKPAAGTAALAEEAVAKRIQRVGTVEIRDASAPAVLRTGEQVYQAACTACHAAGAAGAPKTGDAAAWAAPEDGLRGAAELGAQGQGRHGRAGWRRVQRRRDRPRRRLPGQQVGWQPARAGRSGAGRRGLEVSPAPRPVQGCGSSW
jgi:cytochrome c5